MSHDYPDYEAVYWSGQASDLKAGDLLEVEYTPTPGRDGQPVEPRVFWGLAWESDFQPGAFYVGSSILRWGEGAEIGKAFRVLSVRRKPKPLPTEPGLYFIKPYDVEDPTPESYLELNKTGWWYDAYGYRTNPFHAHNEGRLFKLSVAAEPTNA